MVEKVAEPFLQLQKMVWKTAKSESHKRYHFTMTIITSSCQIPFMMLEEPQRKVVRRERESRSFIYKYVQNKYVPMSSNSTNEHLKVPKRTKKY